MLRVWFGDKDNAIYNTSVFFFRKHVNIGATTNEKKDISISCYTYDDDRSRKYAI